ncbi:MAG: glutamate racemase [Anaerolineae bacterium]|nr:glutamate racemase [Anaerolineae bacterium]
MNPIALFDSGIGGLSVLTHIRERLPGENLLYLADQTHVPYGPRSHAEIIQFSEGITRFFLAQEAKAVVVACNRASAAALSPLRQRFPGVPFVGMEPAVKPAAQQTKSGKVGVLATVGTLESERYASLMARFAGDVTVWEDPCVGLVELIEAGQTDTPETEQFLRRTLAPMLANGVDTLVLGCTHYPFIRPLLHHIAPHLTIIDPAPAVAQQTQRVLQQANLLSTATNNGQTRLITTGLAAPFAQLAQRLMGYEGEVSTAVWQDFVIRSP